MKNHKWLKRLLIILALAIFIIFFGAVAFNLLAYVFDFMQWLFGVTSTALRWLGNIFNFFGFAGIFTAPANISIVDHNLQAAFQFLIIGG